VSAECVLDNREDRTGGVGIERMAGRQEDSASRLDCVGSMVALLEVIGIVAEEVDSLLTLEVSNV
jgi:hypothetical protein